MLTQADLDEITAMGDGAYSELREIDGVVCGLGSFVYTTGLMVGMTRDTSYTRRYCYANRADALKALEEFDGNGHPSGPWIKVKGRMGSQYLDELGPGALC